MASTVATYSAPCRYITAEDILALDTNCEISFGTLSVAGGARYIATFPNGSEIVIYVQVDGSASVNGIPAEVAFGGDKLAAVTNDGEIFTIGIRRR